METPLKFFNSIKRKITEKLIKIFILVINYKCKNISVLKFLVELFLRLKILSFMKY